MRQPPKLWDEIVFQLAEIKKSSEVTVPKLVDRWNETYVPLSFIKNGDSKLQIPKTNLSTLIKLVQTLEIFRSKLV